MYVNYLIFDTFSGKTECPPADPPELARRIMVIYGFDDDGRDYDDDSLDLNHPHETLSKDETMMSSSQHRTQSPSEDVKFGGGGSDSGDSKSDSSRLHGFRGLSATPEDKVRANHKVPIKREFLLGTGGSCSKPTSRPTSRSSSATPPSPAEATSLIASSLVPIAPPLNVPPARRYNHRDGLMDYRLLDAARIQER